MFKTIVLAAMILCLHLTVYGQGNGSQDREKPRNQTPSVGTGGSEGGPTGLFTIYDGSTIRKGEFTFSIAYSNYDRDPGNIEIVDIPLGFNVGLSDHLRLFSKAGGYRGVKVVNVQNLSGFYRSAPPLCIPATTGRAPACNVRPLRRFSFAGAAGSRRRVGLQLAPTVKTKINDPSTGNVSLRLISGFAYLATPPDGIVRETSTTPTYQGWDVSVAFDFFNPLSSYRADAAFANYVYATNKAPGTRFRVVANDAAGFEVAPGYHWYPVVNEVAAFSHLHVAGIVGIGDAGLFALSDDRLSKNINASANVGYIPNSMPDRATRPRTVASNIRYEPLVGVRSDLPVNKEVRSNSEVESVAYAVEQTLNASVARVDTGEIVAFISRKNTRSVQIQLEEDPKLQPAHDSLPERNQSYQQNQFSHLMLGMFIWDPNMSEKHRERIRAALKRGPEDLKIVCSYYGPYSRQCRQFKDAIESFGAEGVDNGVILSVGPIQTKGAGAETSVSSCSKRKKTKDNPTGGRITITITDAAMMADDLTHLLRHEGSHGADGLRWHASGCKRIVNNPFIFETEFKAYYVSSLSAQVTDPDFPYGFQLAGFRIPGKNPYLPEMVPIYRPGLTAEELENLRNVNIPRVLAHPKNAGGLYGVTPKFPGMRVFAPQP